jgi:uncharacterized protein YqhQ
MLASGAEPLRVGGQAVIEGVMMRGPDRWAVTVRTPDGDLKSLTTVHRSWLRRAKPLAWPFVRGTVTLFESLVLGLKALNFSADAALAAEPADQAGQAGQIAAADVTKAVQPPSDRPAPDDARPAKRQPGFGPWQTALTLVLGLGLAIVLFVVLPHAASIYLGAVAGFDESDLSFHLVDGLIKFGVFLAYVWGIGLIPDIRRVYAYHGAEHKAIHVFEAQLPRTPEQARPFPTWHPRCGTAFIFLTLAVSIVFFAAAFPLLFSFEGWGRVARALLGAGLKTLLMMPLSAAAYEIVRAAGRPKAGLIWRIMVWPGLALQRLTTRQPDDSQLEVAFAALEAVLARSGEPVETFKAA